MVNKILKKFFGALGYKLVDKNLLKSQRLISSKSHLTVKLLIDNLVKKGKVKSLIQIGANDGLRFDVLNKYIKEYKIDSLLVEPVPFYYSKLRDNYSEDNFVKLEKSAISKKSGTISMYTVKRDYLDKYDEHIKGINSVKKKHLNKHNVKSNHIEKISVECLSPKDLLKKYKIDNLDLVFIDAEGYDGDIVISFLDYINFKPIIIFEFIHIEYDLFINVTKKLDEKKYNYFSIDENLICFPKEDIFYESIHLK
tara:strand:- start:903 stop:1661 length:759 start_codon:yes stop_codon:yes gene_type:complete